MSIDRRRMEGGYLPLRDAIDQLFEGSFIAPGGAQAGFPPADVHVTENEVVVHMAVPGANPDDINISVSGEVLTISGEVRRHTQNERRQTFAEEIWRGRFQRSFVLPIQVDPRNAEATFENGILTLELPRSEATKPRKIQVRGSNTIQGSSSGGGQSSSAAEAQASGAAAEVSEGQSTHIPVESSGSETSSGSNT